MTARSSIEMVAGSAPETAKSFCVRGRTKIIFMNNIDYENIAAKENIQRACQKNISPDFIMSDECEDPIFTCYWLTELAIELP